MGIAALIGQFLKIAMDAMETIELISNADNEGRELTDDELAVIDAKRHAVEQKWKDALAKLKEKNSSDNGGE